MRKHNHAEGEFYHIYNRGTDKRPIFKDVHDLRRFMQSMEEFNVSEPIGSIYENKFYKEKSSQLGHRMSKLRHQEQDEKLVEFVAFCINPNHYHFILKQVAERGIEKFMQRLGNGYTKYFNGKHKRSGVLFQGKYKSIHVDTNEYLLRLSAYVNLNDRVHKLGHPMSKFMFSSWAEYMNAVPSGESKDHPVSFCKKDVVLEQFKSVVEYKEFAEEAVRQTLENREDIERIEHESKLSQLGHRMSKLR